MKTNIEKWNFYLLIIKNKTDEFFNANVNLNDIPKNYFIVYPIGKIAERTIIGVEYSHYKHNGTTYFSGKKPTKKDIEEIKNYALSNIPFSLENFWFKYSEIWDIEKGRSSESSVKVNDVINRINLFYTLEEAEKHKIKIEILNNEEKEFKEKYKKDANYNYAANGYKFLGWQNGWKHVYFDEDGNLSSETGKKEVSFGYLTKDYPEYGKCRDLKHRHIEVRHNNRGSENTVSCPICKIYWKYDCSD